MTVVTFGNFPAGNLAEIADTTCHADRIAVAACASLGGNSAIFSAQAPTQCYGDVAKVRVHQSGFAGAGVGINPGDSFWWACSLRRTATAQGSAPRPVLNEIHQSGNDGCDPLRAGPAPFNLQVRDQGGSKWWALIIRGANDCGSPSFIQHAWTKLGAIDDDGSTRLQHDWGAGVSPLVTQGEWVHWLLGWKMGATPATGWFEAWCCRNGQTMQSIVPRTNIATCYPLPNYPILSLYFDSAETGLAEYEYAAGAFGDDFAELQAWQNSRLSPSLGYNVNPNAGGGAGGGGTTTVSFPIAVSGDDDYTEQQGAAYPPAGALATGPASAILYADRYFGGGTYFVDDIYLRWDTSAIPDNATVTAARLKLWAVNPNGGDNDARNLIGQWIDPATVWPITTADHSNVAPAGNAFSIDRTTVVAGQLITITLSNVAANVSKTGYTGLRLAIDGGVPLSTNEVRFASKDDGVNPAPTLEVDYSLPSGARGKARLRALCG